MRPDTITVKEAAQRLGIGINQAYEACERGDLPNIRLGKRWIIPRVAFEAWLIDCANAPKTNQATRIDKPCSEMMGIGVASE